MPETTARIASILIAGAFAWAAGSKLLGYRRWRNVLDRYGLPQPLRAVSAPTVPLVELAIAVTVLVVSPRIGAIAAVAVLAVFSLAIMRARALQGDRLPCGCFGGTSERNYQTMIVRNVLLGTLATIVGVSDIATGIGLPSAPTAADTLPVVLVIAGCALALWTGIQAASSLRRREHP
jgi:hypothetical protein